MINAHKTAMVTASQNLVLPTQIKLIAQTVLRHATTDAGKTRLNAALPAMTPQ